MNSAMIGGSQRLLAPDSSEVREIVAQAYEHDWQTRAAWVENRPEVALAFGTREIDPRIIAQQGQFTVHTDNTDLGAIGMNPRSHWRRKFLVPSHAKSELRVLLGSLGISRLTLFPDLHSLAEELKARNIWEG